MSNEKYVTVKPTSEMPDELLIKHLENKHDKNKIAIVPDLSVLNIGDFAASIPTVYNRTVQQNKSLTDVIIPVMYQNATKDKSDTKFLSGHFALIHVKLNTQDGVPTVSWIDSKGSIMPAEIKTAMDAIYNNNYNLNDQVVKHKQQTNGYDCALYVVKNADTLIAGRTDFATISAADAVAMRKDMVATVNSLKGQQFKYVDDNNVVPIQSSMSENEFINKVSDDLVEFGASIQKDGNAAKLFDQAFDKVAAALESANSSLKDNPYSFFYQGLQSDLAAFNNANKVDKNCAQEADKVDNNSSHLTLVR